MEGLWADVGVLTFLPVLGRLGKNESEAGEQKTERFTMRLCEIKT